MFTLDRIRNLFIASALVLALAYSFAVQATVGQPGTLDPFWATGSAIGAGKVITPIGTGADLATAVAIQPDGKVVLAGQCNGTVNVGFCALRYNSDGTVDTGFGNGGKVITSLGNFADFATSVALQPDGKVLIAGQCKYNANFGNFCALRYKVDGSLDLTFGVGGIAITPVGGDDYAKAIALQPDGKFLLAGSCVSSTYTFCARRYNPDGSLDANFGSGGTVVVSGLGTAVANAIAVQPDGGILLAGTCMVGAYCAVRYDAFGALDPSFGSGGKTITQVSTGNNNLHALSLQPDGKAVVAGSCNGGSSYDFCAVRYNGNGTVDTSFGSGGTIITSVAPGATSDTARTIAIQPDGKLLFAGYCAGNFCIVRYHGNGVLDLTFGSGGKVLTLLGNQDSAGYAMALQPDGKIILVGNCYGGTNPDFCAARYDGGPFGYQNCKLDIDGDGRVLATTDMLIGTRIALGMTGNAVVNGINFPSTATRNTWPLIRAYLVTQCGLSLVQ